MSTPAIHPASPPARGHKAFQSVPRCLGCGSEFAPLRRNQKHFRPSCRRLALERRRKLPLLDDDPGDPLRLDGGFE
jgi:hypothetical protein